jgi:GNAT superfamily N-acetyltransferase
MPSVREIPEGETEAAARALLELRPQCAPAANLADLVDRLQRPLGYRLVGSFEDGEADAAAVAGFKIGQMLAWGRYLYVDDLVTAADRRQRGHADRVFEWLLDEARRQECDSFHLDSGVIPERADAHRFYFRHRMRISSYHFEKPL